MLMRYTLLGRGGQATRSSLLCVGCLLVPLFAKMAIKKLKHRLVLSAQCQESVRVI